MQNIEDMKPGREMDAIVAQEAMEFKLDYEFQDFGGAPFVPQLRDQFDEYGLLPAYSTDIAAFSSVMDKMIKLGFHWVLKTPSPYTPDGRYYAGLSKQDVVAWSCGDSLMDAGCRAALKVMDLYKAE